MLSTVAARPRRLRTPGLQALIVLALASAVEIGVRAGALPRSSVAAPSAALAYVVESAARGELWRALQVTLFEIGASFAISVLLGIPLALLCWRFPRLYRAAEPHLVSLYAMPLIFFYPMLLVVFGIGSLPIVLLSILVGLTPIVLNTAAGLAQTRTVWLNVARAFQADRRSMLFKVLLPAAAPLTFTGLRLGVVYIAISVVATEFITGNAGIGYQARYYYSLFKPAELYAYVIVIVLVTVVLNSVLSRVERRFRRELA